MRAKWNTVPISELYDGLYDGPHATPKLADAGPVFLGIKNITDDGHLDMSDIRHIAEEDFAKWTRRIEPKPGDIVFTYEATLNRYAIIPEGFRGCLGRRMALIRTDAKKVDARFLFYYFFSPAWREVIKKNMMTGATVDRIPLITFPSFPVSVPPLPVQKRIAGILSAYDELIENSQRRIRILESMARALYREWFVHFRYPGHEKVPMVRPPSRPGEASAKTDGDIPQGWEAFPFETLLVSMTGGDWGSDQTTETESAEVTIVRGTDFDEVAYGGQLRAPVRYIKPSSLKSRGLRPGDVIVENSINAKSRCIGTTLLVDSRVLARIGRDAVAASFCKVFRLNDPRLAPLVHLHFRRLREDARMEYYQNVAANGIGNFQAQKFGKEEHMILPKDEALRSKLIGGIAAMFESVTVLSSKLSNLRRTRDLLLPRLLSGQISLTTKENNDNA